MPNIAAAFKEEIARVSRKTLRAETESLKRSVLAHRTAIATLRKRLESLERQLKSAQGKGSRAASEGIEEEAGPNLRFRPDGLKKHRERLGLSAADAGKIMGVSALSVYKWESGKTRPRAKQLEAIASLRKMGKREAAAKLAEVQ